MQYFLSKESVLKWLENPSVYHIKKDELYELDYEAFEFLRRCSAEKECGSDDKKFIDYCTREGILTKEPPYNKLRGTEIQNNNKVIARNKETKQSQKQRLPRCARNDNRRPSIKKSPVPSLRYLELQITDRCNLRCRHCYIGDFITLPLVPSHQGRGKNCRETSIKKRRAINKSPLPLRERVRVRGNELSLSRIKKALSEFEETQGLRVLITGGEPLLHSRFKEINSILPAFFLRKILFTNGLLLNKKMLGNLNVNEIQVSIDGMEKAHDSLRGKGTFRRAMRSINLAMDSGFDVSISTMVHQKNLRDFNRMKNLFKKIGIKDWTVDVPCVTGRLRENTDFQLSPKQAGKYLKYGYGGGIHSGEKGFGCGLHLMSISASGKISKCTFYSNRAVGTIKNGLRKCWEKIKPVRLDKLDCDCKYIEKCRGGCRYRAEVLGDAKGKDLYRCALYK